MEVSLLINLSYLKLTFTRFQNVVVAKLRAAGVRLRSTCTPCVLCVDEKCLLLCTRVLNSRLGCVIPRRSGSRNVVKIKVYGVVLIKCVSFEFECVMDDESKNNQSTFEYFYYQ